MAIYLLYWTGRPQGGIRITESYTTGWRISRPDNWGYEFMKELAERQILGERKRNIALCALTGHILVG